MAKQAVDCRNMVRVKVWHTRTTVWLLKNYSQRILTYYTRILLLNLTYGRTMISRAAIRFQNIHYLCYLHLYSCSVSDEQCGIQ